MLIEASMQNILASLIAAAALLTAIPKAPAAAVTGEIAFSGGVTFDTTSLATATTVTSWFSGANPGVLQVQDVTGSYIGHVSVGNFATMAAPWIFNPSTATSGLWTVGGFTFDLTSATIHDQTASFLDITGTGTVSGNGFSSTPALFAFSSQSAGGQMESHFSVSANTISVPDNGSTVALFGLALALLGVVLPRFTKFGVS
jgi:hypothetical protein